MSYPLPDIAITTTNRFPVPIQDNISDVAWIEFQNESAYTLAVQAGGYSFQIPAWMGWPVPVNIAPGFGYPISVQPKTVLNYQATAPAATLSVLVYRTGERPATTTPYALARQTNIGNAVPVGTQATQVINDGNTAPTAVAEGTPSGATSSQMLWNNDGSGVFGGGAGSVDNAANMTVHTLDGILTDTAGGNGVVAHDTGSTVELKPNAAGRAIQADWRDSTGTIQPGPRVTTDTFHPGAWQDAAGNRIDGTSHFSGTGAGTFNHSYAGYTPNFIGITSLEANSTETVGVDTIGSSTVHVNQGVSGWPWTGLAAHT